MFNAALEFQVLEVPGCGTGWCKLVTSTSSLDLAVKRSLRLDCGEKVAQKKPKTYTHYPKP